LVFLLFRTFSSLNFKSETSSFEKKLSPSHSVCVNFLAKCVVLLLEGKRLIIRATTDGKLKTWKVFPFGFSWWPFSKLWVEAPEHGSEFFHQKIWTVYPFSVVTCYQLYEST
jgi:hypothetical protein